MNHRFFKIIPLVTLILLACHLPVRAQTVDPLEGTWTFSESYNIPPATSAIRHYFFQLNEVLFLFDGGGFNVGTYVPVSGQNVTIDIIYNTTITLHYTGTLNPNNNDISGTFTGQDFSHGSPTDVSGTFTAHRDGAPVETIGTLTYSETDTLYVIGTTQFSISKFTATGSISLTNFPNTDPNALVLPDDTELNISFGVDAVGQAIYGGKLSDAILGAHPTPSRKAFQYLPFQPDTFFDGLAALKVPIPKAHKTGALTLAAGWIFTGPHNKPATGMKFSIIGVGRGWQSSAGGGSSNVQGLTGTAAGQLGHASQKFDLDLNCSITFGNASKKVTANFKIAGPASTTTKDVTPKDTKSAKESTVKVSLKGPVKPPS